MNQNQCEISPCVPVPVLSYAPLLIPCHINLATGLFEPLFSIRDVYPQVICSSQGTSETSSTVSGKEKKAKKWLKEEEGKLTVHVETFGTQSWAQIARELNNDYHNGKSVRQGKHCRERWFNHLNPCLRKGDWTAEEDQLLDKYQREMGKCWSKIAKQMPGRTENQVKNRWNSLVRKRSYQLKREAEEELMRGMLATET